MYLGKSSRETIKIFPVRFHAYSSGQTGFLVTTGFRNGRSDKIADFEQSGAKSFLRC